MKESVFAQEMRKSFVRIPGLFYMKIPDSFGMERFAPPKNFDAFVLNKGNFYALEYKIHTTASFPFNKVREVQEKSLVKIYEAGGEAYIIINFRKKPINFSLCFSIYEYLYQKAYWTKLGRKSIPWSSIQNMKNCDEYSCHHVMYRVKEKDGTFWNINALL